MKKSLLITILLTFPVVLSAQFKKERDKAGNATYSLRVNEEDASECISKLFIPFTSENQILQQKCASISGNNAWNNSLSKYFALSAIFVPVSPNKNLECEDKVVLTPGSISIGYIPHTEIKTVINGDKVLMTKSFSQINLNCKIIFHSKTEYEIIVSDIYLNYHVKQKGSFMPVAQRIEYGALLDQENSTDDKYIKIFVELIDNAVSYAINSVKQAVSESVMFLN